MNSKKAKPRQSVAKFYGRKNQERILRRIARREINRTIETKQANIVFQDGAEIQHNDYIVINGNLLATTQGTGDPMVGDVNNRIGDEITLRGLSIRGMLELNERYSDVTCRIMVVKSAKGDSPTYSTLFQGITQNKMLDRFNTERYTILASKIVKLKAPNVGTWATVGVSGTAGAHDANVSLSRTTKIFKMWIPGSKFSRNSIIKYENGTAQPKFFDYTLLCFAYANYSTTSTPPLVFFVARVNDCVCTMYYKDA